jgi:UDP-2,3-diacylglucosamine hydrolase
MQKVYFVSDSHLGVPDHASSLQRELMLISWLDKVAVDAEAIYLLGDIFDFWFEYNCVVPKGFVRLFGKLAELTDRGIPIHFFTGNHDLWAFDYFEQELGLVIHRHPIELHMQGKLLLVGHGDGLGPGDHGYKMIKKVFTNRVTQKLFSFLHPGFGTRLALAMSKKSRIANGQSDKFGFDPDKEAIVAFCRSMLSQKQVDYFIFGHRHFPICTEIAPGSFYINTGDWVTEFSYVVLDQGNISIMRYTADI